MQLYNTSLAHRELTAVLVKHHADVFFQQNFISQSSFAHTANIKFINYEMAQ